MEFDPILSIRNLRKSFTLHAVDGRTVVALRGVDLDLHQGEHCCLAGSSGAGKSSVLKAIHRTYMADGGSIEYRSDPLGTWQGETLDLCSLDDPSVTKLRATEIGYVSQFLRSEPRRGALDVVARAAMRLGVPVDDARSRAAEVLLRLNIDEHLWQTYPTLLSGGEKQRVNLAAGIVAAPRLLLLDEPVSALDPRNRAAVLDVIADLTDQGTSVLSVFHDLPAIRQLADRVVLMDAGKVIAEGLPDAVLDREAVLA